ncbi:DMT family transporter [Aliigemmobacter aestuarii]|uniref:DMT family transporter n=2 Tax=Aliigemmobacter aestuarii TaxID=1445661 RepID=A0A4S3MV14_9RHOB|nr:DMT family transporter [Gemmobacter aestuarii]
MPSPALSAPLPANGRGILLLIAAVAIFTAMDALAKVLITSGYPVLQVVWARYTGQTVIVALALLPRLTVLLRTRYPKLQALRSVFQFGATALFFASLGHIGLAEATALTDINPILITLGAAIFLGERLGPRRIFGVVLAMIGALIVIRPGFGVFTPAALLPLGCAVCYAGYAIATRWVGRDESPWTSLIYAALLGTVVTSAVLPFVWQAPAGAGDLALFLVIGLLGAAAQYFLIHAFTVAEASAIAPFGYVGLIFATFWGIVLFGEYPDGWTIVGALVIVAAGVYVWHRETMAHRQARLSQDRK